MAYKAGDYTFFLYAYGTKDIPSQELKDMLLFLVDSSEENAKNEDLRAVRTMMNEIKSNSEIGVKHMIASEHDRDVFVRGYERGYECGKELGKKFTKSVLRLEQEGNDISEIAEKLQIGEDEVRMIIKVSKDYNIEELDSNRKL